MMKNSSANRVKYGFVGGCAFVVAIIAIVASIALAKVQMATVPTPNKIGVPVSYQLPTDGPLPQTYRVTLAIAPTTEPDWLVSTFVAGGVRTVTKENAGRFTEIWNGLDDNGMPVPAGQYRVKGIYMPARQWKIDGQYHSLLPKYVVSAGDSWSPAPENDQKLPWLFGHDFGYMTDVQVGPNGRAGFLASYIENAFNPFLVDMTKQIGYDQVLAKYDSWAIGGGGALASDGEHIWFASDVVGQPFVYREDRAWGSDANVYGVRGKKLTVAAPSLAVWKNPVSGKRFLYVAQPDKVNKVLVLDGDGGQTRAEIPLLLPQAITIDRTAPGRRLIVMHADEKNARLVSAIALKDGLPQGAWTPLFKLNGIAKPIDCEMDSQGNFYISSTDSNQVYKLDSRGRIIQRFGRAVPGKSGRYDPLVFMSPSHLATWKDASGKDRLIVLESAGPGRISEWTTDGTLIRQWFLSQPGAQGYCLDPEKPEHVYATGQAGGLIRYLVDYNKATWNVDAVWPTPLGGKQYPKVINLGGRKYIAFAGGAFSNNVYMIYRIQGEQLVPSAGIVVGADTKSRFWWHDANGDGQVQETEYKDNPANMPALNFWGDYWLDDLSLFVADRQTPWVFLRLAPTGFDRYGNPIYNSSKWSKLLTDTVYEARVKGNAPSLRGGNEVASGWGGWERIDGSMREGFYVADPSGPPNPGGVDNAGSRYAQFKLSRYVPDGKGGFRMKWRVGRKAWRLAEPGEVYATQHLSAPVYGIVGTLDSNGLYHLYSHEGLYLDTLMLDVFRFGLPKGGMYAHSGETWYGKHYLNKNNGKVYLFMGRAQNTIYEVEGWKPNLVRPLPLQNSNVSLASSQIAPANQFALAVRAAMGNGNASR